MTRKDRIADAPPSAKLVYYVLRQGGQLTPRELATETRLSPRTVRTGLSSLDEQGVVHEMAYIPDARKKLYAVVEPDDPPPATPE